MLFPQMLINVYVLCDSSSVCTIPSSALPKFSHASPSPIVLFRTYMTLRQLLKCIHLVYQTAHKQQKCPNSFLSVAVWVILDQEGDIMVVTHRVHYRPRHGAKCRVHRVRCTTQWIIIITNPLPSPSLHPMKLTWIFQICHPH